MSRHTFDWRWATRVSGTIAFGAFCASVDVFSLPLALLRSLVLGVVGMLGMLVVYAAVKLMERP